jgi:hypothetical protein
MLENKISYPYFSDMGLFNFSKKTKAKFINVYAPFLGAGIQLKETDEHLRTFKVAMRLTWFNKNIKGVHFGGSLYAMCDPFYMWILMENLGSEYIVWDKAASIQFKKPGTGTVEAIFHISEPEIEQIRQEVNTIGRNDYVFKTVVTNEDGQIVAEVEKTVYVRKKNFERKK